MGTKVIRFSLDPHSITEAMREVRRYKYVFQQQVKKLREKIAERIAWSASNGFNTAQGEDVIFGSPDPVHVEVTVTHEDDISFVFADGDQAVFIEYGAGVYNNGAAGFSPHPWGVEKGFLIGEYGQGKGKRKAWGYINSAGEVVVTHGKPAAMPMYHGMMDAIRVIDELVQEVFDT